MHTPFRLAASAATSLFWFLQPQPRSSMQGGGGSLGCLLHYILQPKRLMCEVLNFYIFCVLMNLQAMVESHGENRKQENEKLCIACCIECLLVLRVTAITDLPVPSPRFIFSFLPACFCCSSSYL